MFNAKRHDADCPIKHHEIKSRKREHIKGNKYKFLVIVEIAMPERCKPDYDNGLYLHQLQELHQWAMELRGACMHHEGDSENHKEINETNFT